MWRPLCLTKFYHFHAKQALFWTPPALPKHHNQATMSPLSFLPEKVVFLACWALFTTGPPLASLSIPSLTSTHSAWLAHIHPVQLHLDPHCSTGASWVTAPNPADSYLLSLLTPQYYYGLDMKCPPRQNVHVLNAWSPWWVDHKGSDLIND
jgi:hypothetical protein